MCIVQLVVQRNAYMTGDVTTAVRGARPKAVTPKLLGSHQTCRIPPESKFLVSKHNCNLKRQANPI